MMYSDSTLSVKDAAGRQISLLNDHQQIWQKQSTPASSLNGKRKYHCTESGCNKSFTTSGHLARHHRIHSGEKNFHCLHPGCPSRFSRQDNMMQHYRTHLSPKSRRYHQRHRQQSQQISKNIKDHHPRLHCHTLVGSESEATTHRLTDIKAAGDLYAVTRARRSSTMPSSFHPYQQQLPTRNRHQINSVHSGPCSLVQPLFTSAKPLPMEPESSPPLSTNMYQSSHRPQRAHSASSTSSSSSSFLSPRSPTLSPPPLIDQTDIIYPKNFIQLPPLQQEMHMGNQGQRVSDMIHTVSIFG